mgnify:FL=1
MSLLRALIIGTVIGTIVGVLSLAIAHAGLSINGTGTALPTAVILSAVIGSAAAGSSGVILGYLLTNLERSATTALISLAVASLILLPGEYANSSLLPALVYAMALANGLIVARAVGPFCHQPSGSAEYYLS